MVSEMLELLGTAEQLWKSGLGIFILVGLDLWQNSVCFFFFSTACGDAERGGPAWARAELGSSLSSSNHFSSPVL
ncbi:hypothetical protein M0R45_030961 [Rubus argutus]|uniref:Uncharacterized protein n=1 Tax=Rubus argutus TaxID=59490 RepID=A0AAW1WG38_RUBAR